MAQRESQKRSFSGEKSEIILTVTTITLFVTQLFLYFRNLDTTRFVVGRLIYSGSLITTALTLLFTLQYGLLFYNFLILVRAYRTDDHDEKKAYIVGVMTRIGFFLLFNMIAEVIIIRLR